MVMDGSDGLKGAAGTVYPNMPALLCIWHVNKRIVAHCKGYFTTNEKWEAFFNAWQRLIQSPTLDEFDERWLQFVTDYNHGGTKSCIDYIEKEWIRPRQTERLVTAWTN